MTAKFVSFHKIGGKSLVNKNRLQSCLSFLEVFSSPRLIMLSALGKTTSLLLKAIEGSISKNNYENALTKIYLLNYELPKELLAKDHPYFKAFEEDWRYLQAELQICAMKGEIDELSKDKILSLGEFWSSRFIMALLNGKAHLIDASKILVIDKHSFGVEINWHKTNELFESYIRKNIANTYIVTGYIARDLSGNVRTLGFEGSDLSAAIFGKLFGVDKIKIWTDIGAFYTADPNMVDKAHQISELSYHEAMELAFFGAKVIHPQAIQVALEEEIEINISSLYQTEKPGTLISGQTKPSDSPVRGISVVEDVGLINIEGIAFSHGVALHSKILSTLNQASIPILLISQASCEQSFCLAVKNTYAPYAMRQLKEALAKEISNKQLKRINLLQARCSCIVAVGDAMSGLPGVSAQLFASLAKANINVRAYCQGSSERNISVIIDSENTKRAMNIIHASFCLSKRQFQIALIGVGNVGTVLLRQIIANKNRLEKKFQAAFEISAISSSKKMLFNVDGINDADTYLAELQTSKEVYDLEKMVDILSENDLSHTIVIDCTSSDKITKLYPHFIGKGFHVVTPNKKATSGPMTQLKLIKSLCQKNNRYFLYETNVCAGLPVIKTLQDLVATGDDIESIQGVFSGTLSYIFNELHLGYKFSEVLLKAYNLGLTEPDPRDDLSGMDVARKAVCLARELGFECELNNVDVAPILPSFLLGVDNVDSFLAQGQKMDQVFEEHLKAMPSPQHKLIYIAKISSGGHVSLQLDAVDSLSPFYHLKGTENMVSFTTRRYKDYPLIVQGPGAGAEVTAAGVFADLLRLVELTSGRL